MSPLRSRGASWPWCANCSRPEGRAGCSGCHAVGARAALFTDHRFHDTGVARAWQPGTLSLQLAAGLATTLAPSARAGLIERRTATNDRRGVVATLTDKGFELLERAAVDHVTAVRRVLVDVVEPGDWEALGRAMKAVLAVADSDT